MLFWFLTLPIRVAFYGRWKGMAHSYGTQLNRLLFGFLIGLECTILAYSWNYPLYIGAVCGLMAFLSGIEGHSTEQVDTMQGYIGMSIIMTITLEAILLPVQLWMLHIHKMHWISVFVLPLGLLAGFADWLGYRMKGSLSFFGIQWAIAGDTSFCELYRYGLSIGLPLMLLELSAPY